MILQILQYPTLKVHYAVSREVHSVEADPEVLIY